MSGAQPLRVERRVQVPVMTSVVFVQEAEGAVHVVWAQEGWPAGPRALMNDFAVAATPAQLRELADAVEAALARQEATNAA